MELLIRKYHEEEKKFFGGTKTNFFLHAQIQLTPAEEVLAKKHKLDKAIIYDSDEDPEVKAADSANDGSAGGFASSYGALRGLTLGVYAVDDFIRGVTIKAIYPEEIERMDEIIKAGCRALKDRLKAYGSDGSEEITKFD